jgi:hypothetical protein
MYDAHVRRLRGVENYTIVQEVMGFETTQYFEKEMVDGSPVFRLRKTMTGGMAMDAEGDEDQGWEEFYTDAPRMAEHFDYAGRDEVAGHRVHVLVVNDPDAIDFDARSMSPEEEQDFRAEKVTVYVDTDQLVMRRMVVDGQMSHEGEYHDVTSTIDLDDYRDVAGMLHPFRMTMRMTGMQEAMGMTEADMAEMRQQMEEAKRQMEQMPEAQRKMMEKMLEQQMQNMEQMMGGGEGGDMTVEMLVTDLRVNSGPPGE